VYVNESVRLKRMLQVGKDSTAGGAKTKKEMLK